MIPGARPDPGLPELRDRFRTRLWRQAAEHEDCVRSVKFGEASGIWPVECLKEFRVSPFHGGSKLFGCRECHRSEQNEQCDECATVVRHRRTSLPLRLHRSRSWLIEHSQSCSSDITGCICVKASTGTFRSGADCG